MSEKREVQQRIVFAGGKIAPVQAVQGVGMCREGVFLAGPTIDRAGWRPEAIRLFEELSFAGPVYVPEPYPDAPWLEYEDQVTWERTALEASKVVLFWIPRDMATAPGMTTNIEFGMYLGSKKIVLGAPSGAPHMRYIEHVAKLHGIPTHRTLLATIHASILAHRDPHWAEDQWGARG